MSGGFHTERITVLVKTKPTPSKKRGALICTAGINQYGEWRRLYPIRWDRFFTSSHSTKFHRWDVVDVSITKAVHDFRLASYKIDESDEIKLVGRVSSYPDKASIIRDHLYPSVRSLWGNGVDTSMAIIKPERITRVFFTEPTTDNCIMPNQEAKPDIIPTIKIRYKCSDPMCHVYHSMSLIDWEFTETLRKNIKKYGLDEGQSKFIDIMNNLIENRDIYFILGNSWDYYRWPKKWFITGLIYIPNGFVSNTWEW